MLEINLTGRKAIVTGASKGIGKGIALALAQAGADVLVNYNGDKAGAEDTVAAIRSLGRQAFAVQADVSQPEAIIAMMRRYTEEWGDALDILVNNAGISPLVPFLDMTYEQWSCVLNTNLTGAAFCAQAALRLMLPRGYGKIINIGSLHSERTTPEGRAPYAAAKGGMNALTRALAVEFGPAGIRINTLIVGAVGSERTMQFSYDEVQAAAWRQCIPVGRWGQCDEIAHAVAFLASPLADWVNGSCWQIDGGHISKLEHPITESSQAL